MYKRQDVVAQRLQRIRKSSRNGWQGSSERACRNELPAPFDGQHETIQDIDTALRCDYTTATMEPTRPYDITVYQRSARLQEERR